MRDKLGGLTLHGLELAPVRRHPQHREPFVLIRLLVSELPQDIKKSHLWGEIGGWGTAHFQKPMVPTRVVRSVIGNI